MFRPLLGEMTAAGMSVAVYVLAGTLSVCSPRVSAAGDPARTLHLPADRSLGSLSVQDVNAVRRIETFHYWIDGAEWDYLGPARGDVVVPAGKRLMLSVAGGQWRDLSPLLKLKPDDLYRLSIHGSFGGGRPGDSCMTYVAHLTGLRALDLTNTGISGAAMKYVSGMRQLERLTLPAHMDDAGMAIVAGLPSLTGLYFKENRVTDAGLAHLAKLTTLEELELGGARITDKGLTHLAGLPRLRYLVLWGKGFSDAGLRRLKAIPHLETLSLGALEQVTDVGVACLSEIPQLRDVDLYRGYKVTDRGMAYLKKLPHLRRLDLRHAAVTDAGLMHLKEAMTLEYLMLPHSGITDKGFDCLAQLTQLRELHVPRPHYVDPAMDKGYYTDAGVKAISRLTSMEKLSLAGYGVTDEGVRHLTGMVHLKELDFFGCGRLTDESLETIAGFRSLQTLRVKYARLAMTGLKPLNRLTSLENLTLDEVVQDNSGLDLSGLANLRDLSFSLARKQADGEVAAYREEDIAALGRLTSLRRLQISHTGIPDASALRHLTGLKRLERLSIGGNGCTDEAVAYLAELPNLSSLTLSGTFTDASLVHLRKLHNLTLLDFMSGANFSPRALSDFRASMPCLGLYRDFEKKQEWRGNH